ncbi:MAG: L-glutamate gamma-semialdehyde dehydrogenase [Acidobacteria bacterium]|nr:L-glutamate gamma-semialdehyde dehydrogenase [Acidobacteriota bacterium]
MNGIVNIPTPVNEPVREYAPGSAERASLEKKLEEMMSEKIEIPIIIGGEEIRNGNLDQTVCPFDHAHVLGDFHQAGAPEVEQAVEAAKRAWEEWSEMPWEARAAIFLKAADLLAGPWRDTINAATMLNQAKTVHQAEIDSACEMIDFFRFNAAYMEFIYRQQPQSSPGVWNYVEYRALEGFVFAVTPFNFSSIAGNLPTSAAMMGNVVLWKPASTAIYSGYWFYRMMEEAGLPPGVINFLPGHGPDVGDPALDHPDLAGVHFTGSTATFQSMWKRIGGNIARYRTYPRIVGETGGKDFVFAHPSADPVEVATALVRGAFEYQGQKCSAASRAYIPASLWDEARDSMTSQLDEISMGSPLDFSNFVSAVIDAKSFASIRDYIEHAKKEGADIIAGGGCDDSTGYFVEPTVVVTKDPKFKLMKEEIFGPVLTIYVYEDDEIDEALELCDTTSPYGLTGAIFARDRYAIVEMMRTLRHTAGNFYINDKPTGAVVGQQPFGGSRASGTNDKAGSYLNLLRWTSQRSIKETFVPARHFSYPFLGK